MTIRATTAPPLGRPFVANRRSPQAVGLAFWLPTIDGCGAVLRDRAYGNAATWTGTPAYAIGQPIVVGVTTALGNYLSIPASDLLNTTGPVSISAWVKKATGASGLVWQAYNNGGGFSGYGFGVGAGTNTGKVAYWSSTTFAWREGTTSVATDTWTHICVTVAGTAVTFYINGFSDGTASSNQPAAYNGVRYVGGIGAAFAGSIADLRVYHRTLSAAEVFALYAPQTRWQLYGVRLPRGRAASGVVWPVVGPGMVGGGHIVGAAA